MSIQHLVPGQSPLSAEIVRTFLPVSPKEQKEQLIKTIALNSLYLGAAIIGRIGLYTISTQFSPQNPALGNTLATCFVTSWGFVAYNAYRKLGAISDLRPRLQDSAAKNSWAKEACKVAAAIAGGFLAEAPFIYLAGASNKNFVYSIPACGNIIIPAVSLYLTMSDEDLFKKDSLKAKILKNLQNLITKLPSLDPEALQRLTDLTENMASSEVETTEKEALIRELFNSEESSRPETSYYAATTSIATLFSAAQLAWIFYLAFNGWDTVTDNLAAAILLGVIAVAINVYYSQELMMHFWQNVPPLLTGTRPLSLAEKHHPYLTTVPKVIATAISCGAFGAPAVLGQEMLPSPYNTISAVLFGGQNVMAPIPPLTASIDDTVSWFAERPGNAFRVHNLLKRLLFIIENASAKAVNAFMESSNIELTAESAA